MTLADLRRDSGLTQEQIADALGIKQPYYSKLERVGGNPTLKVIRGIADAFDRPIGDVAEALVANMTGSNSDIPGYLNRLRLHVFPSATVPTLSPA